MGWSYRTRGIARGFAAALLSLAIAWIVHDASRGRPPGPDASIHKLFEGTRRHDDSMLPPPMSKSAAPTRLPLRPSVLEDAATWVALPFSLPRDATDAWTLSLRFQPSALVYLDGRLLAQSVPRSQADRPSTELHLGGRMLVANVPPDWLAAGDHLLQVRLGRPGASGALLERVELGPAEAFDGSSTSRSGWTVARFVTALSALVLGSLLLLSGLADRGQRVYLLAGAHVLLLALLLSPYLFQQQPLPLPWWRVLLDIADVSAKALQLAIVVLLSRTMPEASSRRWLRACATYAAVGIAVDGTAAALGWSWTDFTHAWPWWALGSRFCVLVAAAALAWRETVRRTGIEPSLTATLVGLSAWLWAYVTLFVLVLPGRIEVRDVNVVAYAGWVLWVGILLQRNFIASTRRERTLRQEAAEALALRTRELQASFAALQVSERERTAVAERELLLQEMHDGLGSQLMAAKMNAQAGALSATDMTALLEACILELRQTVDTLSVTDGDMGLLLATIRHRMDRTFRAAGLMLDWQVTDLPLVPALAGPGGRELVRIVQEAVTNVMAHARASRLAVRTELSDDGRGVVLSITDDGVGLRPGSAAGRGLLNIRKRARRLGGTVEWVSPLPDAAATPRDRQGTRLVLWLPLRAVGG